MMMRTVARPSVAEPFPYDILVNRYGLMCGDPERGVKSTGIAGEKPDDLGQVTPTTFSYGSLNPRLGAITPYRAMPRGMGLRMQESAEDGQYRYTVNANLSCGVWQKGPDLATISPSSHDNLPVTRSWEMGGAFYWINGRYALKMDSAGVVTVSKDFGVGKVALDAVTFWSNAGSQSYAYVAMGDADNIWRFDGTTWTQAAGTLRARAFAVVGRNIWKAHDRNKITLCNLDADPFIEANWAAPNSYYVGSRDYQINRLIVMPGGELVALKEDGPWVFDLEELDRPLYPFMKFVADSTGGEAFGTWGNNSYVSYGKSSYEMDPGLGIDPMGIDRLTNNDTPVRGRVTAYYGHEAFTLYAGVYNEDTGNSYLCLYGGWQPGEDGGSQLVKAWHGSITQAFVGLRITMLVGTSVSAPANHKKLVIGLSDGTLRTFVLPCVANPVGCSSYRWSTADGEVYLPTWTATFDANSKALRQINVAAYNFSSANWVEVYYRTDPDAPTYTALGDVFNSGIEEAVHFDFGKYATLVDWKVLLRSSATTSCPQVRGMGVHYQLHTEFRRIRTASVLAADGLLNRRGQALRWDAQRIVEILRQAHDSPAGVPMVWPDETANYYKIIGWREVLAWDRAAESWRSAIEITAGEVIDDTPPHAFWNGKYNWDGTARWG
jgi:hypothetical protein